ncbi:DUF4382 domain-containing protein [Geobacter sp. AOG1]|uniref:DUF4382 domain-containing protein n=1 Tax=Geobacter sp. AOG1 TaxID=1566346 RepID=UPI001CC71F9D|nr:DUF4382 domain-containing protein [Geobacter sp. AOG1]GFE58430.1 lipoprotein [Geobacter sp. AOG1]
MQEKTKIALAGVLLFAFAVLSLGQLSGCGGGGGGITTGTASGSSVAATGILQVSITDRPAPPELASIHLNIIKVVVVPKGKEDLADDDPDLPVIAVFPGGTDVDILNLHFVPQILGTTAIPAGSYSQVRLILASNSPTLSNYVTLSSNPDKKRPLKTPSAQQSGLKVIGNFTVTANKYDPLINTIILDFDPNDAIVFAGKSDNIILKPTGIRITQVFNSLTNAGAIYGLIHTPVFNPHSSSTFRSWSSAKVSVVQNSSVVASGVVFSIFSSPSVWKSTFNAFLPAGPNYKVFVNTYRDTSLKIPAPFQMYSSSFINVTQGVDSYVVQPDGIIYLKVQ